MSVLVSCITPTCNREWCLPYSIAQFQEQTYEPKELIVLDNGSRSVEHLVPDAPNIHYRRATTRGTGPLRNEAIGYSSGEVIVHWDDDDIHHPWQLNYYVGFMGYNGAKVTGADEMAYYDLYSGECWNMAYRGMENWIHGSSLVYRRDVWERVPFAGHKTEDMFWLRDIIEVGIVPMAGYPWSLQVNLMHDQNVAPKNTHRPWWNRIDELPGWTKRQRYQDLLEAGRRHIEDPARGGRQV